MTRTVGNRLLLGALLAGGFLVSASSFAQPDRDRDRGPDRGYQYGAQHRDDRGDHGDRDNARGGPGHWNRGDRLPPEYRDRQYVVDDWRGYGLPPPARGRHWVGIGADFYLVGPNGAIVEIGERR
ncbi:RcnB family protein [Cupriavidus basilensis]|uniref:RcnB family protein n=1 Tax=Cupriavidus basilensis TaxID=68895 RepID=A0ABT6AZH6_9BURK|nr:RcnB family protein [Cupriavidus basilensis]MDF3838022.1 RcnB family protein [Cupriavidus basilensis]